MCHHKMCDLCGVRECSNGAVTILPYACGCATIYACDLCLIGAVRFAYDACCRWGGTVIDVNQPCGKSASV